MKWWSRRRPRDWTVEDTGGAEARKRAEAELQRMREEVRQTRAETAQWEQRAERAREHKRENGLARLFIEAAGGGRK